MIAVNQNDVASINEIESRQAKLSDTLESTINAVNTNDKNLATALLREAQHLAFNVDIGLQVRIMNEEHDFEMHSALKKVITRLEWINHANQTTY